MKPDNRGKISSLTRPIILTLRFSNSSFREAKAPSSVVQTGVKSAGWEKGMAQLSPMNSWKSMLPWVVWAVKLGAANRESVSIFDNWHWCKSTGSSQTQTRLFLGDVGNETAQEGLLHPRSVGSNAGTNRSPRKGSGSPGESAESAESHLGED